MRYGLTIPARPIFADRNGQTKISIFGASTLAPHGTTSRWSYTCPATKKNASQLMSMVLSRETAAAPAALAYGNITLLPNGGGSSVIAYVPMNRNNVGDSEILHLPAGVVILPGDALTGQTTDGSTGGTINWFTANGFIEYDA
mgnify:CR=1 FL=1